MSNSSFHAGGDLNSLRDSATMKGAESESAAFKMSSEALLGLAGLSQQRGSSDTSSNPEVAQMLNGFSLDHGSDGQSPIQQGLDSQLGPNSNDRDQMGQMPEGAQMAMEVVSSVMNGLADVGQGFAAAGDESADPSDSSGSAADAPVQPPSQSPDAGDGTAAADDSFPPSWMKRLLSYQ